MTAISLPGITSPEWTFTQRAFLTTRSAGLRPVRIELLPKDMTLPGVEPLRGWVRTTWLPYLERVPPERRSEFVDELVTRYVGRHPLDAEGCVHVAMVRLEAELVKDDCTDDTPLC